MQQNIGFMKQVLTEIRIDQVIYSYRMAYFFPL